MFLISKIKKVFIKLRQVFIEAPILNHSDLQRYIQIEKDTFGYAICEILNKLTLDDLGQCHLVAFFAKKMIPDEIWYETHDGKLLAII